ncbi:LolA family protein [Thermococcus waiotapuensis]|uniref:Uncharacterized protein n=1 Tax=Thermococcus waiotapuensis TaxID=90909 RepID=A0AAE4T4D5_9EURY|nr:hypothetical protein [Thermococcus waiotapuensis]MDV3104661.1 hypothetical protein [Thermococcus waiotapuensis]
MMKSILVVLIGVALIVGFSAGCISAGTSIDGILSYWRSINSFTARETIKLGNQIFESYVNFTRPDKITRADYVNGSLIQEIRVENGVQKVVTVNGTFILNATLDDVNILDPFALILNNLGSFNVTKRNSTLLLTSKTGGLLSYEVELNGKLPKKITVRQAGLVLVVEYKMITAKT